MAYSSLSDFINVLERNGELIRIKEFVNPDLEISEIADRFSKFPGGGKALLFENTGTEFPVLINSMGSEKRMCLALGISQLDEVSSEIASILDLLSEPRQSFLKKISIIPSLSKYAGYMPVKVSRNIPCQEIIDYSPDLNTLPVLKTWPFDGGRFITFPLVHTIDPETGVRNVGMYRMQVFDGQTTGMHWHRHKTGASHFLKYKKAGKRMPVAVALGGDPALTYSATAPLPDQLDEYIFAGFLRKTAVRLCKAITQDIDVPADADFIIEGYVDPEEDFRVEGPFGDHTGFYSLADNYPVFHITCITRRKEAIYPATVVGIPPMEDAWIAKATERIFLWPIKKTVVPELTEMNIPEFGVAHNLTIASISKSFPGQAEKVMNALWGAGQMMFNKFMVITDNKDIISDYPEIIRRISVLDFEKRLVFSRGPLDVLDHSAQRMGFGSKLGIDLTIPLEEEDFSYPNKKISEPTSITPKKSRKKINSDSFYTEEILPGSRILIVNVDKETREELIEEISNLTIRESGTYPRIILFLDKNVDSRDPYHTCWVALNNIDPIRDITIARFFDDSVMIVDATSKGFSKDRFTRPWPNVIVMDDTTIDRVDKFWKQSLKVDFIESPSRKFKALIKNSGAEVNPDSFNTQ
ncbi:MAG: menaquinone biosynthesis decarboxylase [Bacteroidales bacterium]|nr:menaquinone biosynthesis decarboxylase [Bacteroidales bacterium]